MMFTDPGLVIAERIQLLQQFQIAFERKRRVLADTVKRREEGTEAKASGHGVLL